MGRKTATGTGLLVALLAASLALYSHFVGFERESLAGKLPADTYASLSVRHVRKLGFAFASDEQLQSAVSVIQAIGKILERSVPSFDFPGDDPEIDDALLLELAKHFKTRLTLAALPRKAGPHDSLGYALLSHFYGRESDFLATLEEITRQAASSSGIELGWTSELWDGVTLRYLSSSLAVLDPELPELDLCWAIFDGTLYLSTHRDSLRRLIAHAKAPSSESVLKLEQGHSTGQRLADADLTLLVNAQPSLALLAQNAQADLIREGGLAASFSPPAFVEALKLHHLESIAVALEFTGDRTAYSGVTYRDEIPLLTTLAPNKMRRFIAPDNTPLFAYESLGIDSGDALLLVKDAFLKAAPLANFPYFALRSQIQRDSGLELEATLASAFEPQVTLFQTVDFGTGRNRYGDIQEQVVFDAAYKFQLRPGNGLPALLESQIPRLSQQAGFDFDREDGILYLDRDPDATVTSGRLALSYTDTSIVFGAGTLKSFRVLHGQADSISEFPPPPLASLQPIGNGALAADALPAALFQLAAVLYQQVNNTRHIPTAFMDFDWGSLSALEQRRASTTYHSEGHLFRVSKQID